MSKLCLFLAVVFFYLVPTHAFALPLKESGVLTGLGTGSLKGQDNYMPIPVIWHLGYDFNQVLRKINLNTASLVELYLEPQINPVASPSANAEFGCGLGFQIIFAPTAKISPYLCGGSGLIYITQSTKEQSTKYNFQDQVGGGLYYFFNKNSAVSGGYRLRHISNGGIKHPNSGINTHMVEAGYSVFF